MTEQQKLYTPAQVAQILNLKRITIYKHIKQGKVKPVRLYNGRLRITQAELDRLLPREAQIYGSGVL